jgi:hypothetical protein
LGERRSLTLAFAAALRCWWTAHLAADGCRRQQDLLLLFQLKVATMEEASSRIFNLQTRKQQAAPHSPLQLFNNFALLLEEQGDDHISSPDPPAPKVQPARAHT